MSVSIPLLAHPAEGSTVGPNINFRWYPTPGAVRYRVQVTTVAYVPVFTTQDVTSTNVSLTVPLGVSGSGVTYKWYVRAYDAAGGSQDSAFNQFTVVDEGDQVAAFGSSRRIVGYQPKFYLKDDGQTITQLGLYQPNRYYRFMETGGDITADYGIDPTSYNAPISLPNTATWLPARGVQFIGEPGVTRGLIPDSVSTTEVFLRAIGEWTIKSNDYKLSRVLPNGTVGSTSGWTTNPHLYVRDPTQAQFATSGPIDLLSRDIYEDIYLEGDYDTGYNQELTAYVQGVEGLYAYITSYKHDAFIGADYDVSACYSTMSAQFDGVTDAYVADPTKSAHLIVACGLANSSSLSNVTAEFFLYSNSSKIWTNIPLRIASDAMSQGVKEYELFTKSLGASTNCNDLSVYATFRGPTGLENNDTDPAIVISRMALRVSVTRKADGVPTTIELPVKAVFADSGYLGLSGYLNHDWLPGPPTGYSTQAAMLNDNSIVNGTIYNERLDKGGGIGFNASNALEYGFTNLTTAASLNTTKKARVKVWLREIQGYEPKCYSVTITLKDGASTTLSSKAVKLGDYQIYRNYICISTELSISSLTSNGDNLRINISRTDDGTNSHINTDVGRIEVQLPIYSGIPDNTYVEFNLDDLPSEYTVSPTASGWFNFWVGFPSNDPTSVTNNVQLRILAELKESSTVKYSSDAVYEIHPTRGNRIGILLPQSVISNVNNLVMKLTFTYYADPGSQGIGQVLLYYAGLELFCQTTVLHIIVQKHSGGRLLIDWYIDASGKVGVKFHDTGGTLRTYVSSGSIVSNGEYCELAVNYKNGGSYTVYKNGAEAYTTSAGAYSLGGPSDSGGIGSMEIMRELGGKLYILYLSREHIESAANIVLMAKLGPDIPRSPHYVDFSDKFEITGKNLLQDMGEIQRAVERGEGQFFYKPSSVKVKNV